MRIFGVLIIFVSLLLTILSAFFGLALGMWGKGLIDTASLVCVLGPVLGGCLVAYGSEWGVAFKPRPNREEAAIAVGVYKLAVRISIGAGFFGVMFGVIAMLGAMGSVSGGMDLGGIDRRSRRSVDYGSIRVGLRLLFISTLAILLPTPVGPGDS